MPQNQTTTSQTAKTQSAQSQSTNSASTSGGGEIHLVSESDSSPHPTTTRAPRDFAGQSTVRNHSGLVMPRLGFGTWQISDEDAAPAVAGAIQAGYRHIDTAQMYGNESGVGRGIAASGVDRSELFITTKIDDANHEPDDLARSVDRSLEALGTDHVDLLLIHWPTEWDRIGATLAGLARVHAAGLAYHIGVSNFTIEQLEQAREHAPLEVLQAECHPFLQQRALRQWCQDHDWLFTAYSPVARGQVMDEPALQALADDIGDRNDESVTPAQVSLAWLCSLPGVSAIPRSTSSSHRAANLRAASIELTDREQEAVGRLDRGQRLVDPDHAPWN